MVERDTLVESPQRRRFERHAVLLECRVDGSSSRASARITDFSVVGCYVDTAMPMTTGSRITLTLTVDTGDAADIALTGTVGRTHPGHGFVLEFEALPDAVRDYVCRVARDNGRSGESGLSPARVVPDRAL